ncbi:MAG TPA: transposase, partial [Candidatus Accumulibacter phosphatis]|nr:transposase [Candidatus Accumulibacter phosphatis]
KMLAAIEAAGVGLPASCPRQWVAHCQSVGSGDKALIDLGRHLYRGVIREQDILACENGRVRFRYRNAQTGKSARRTLSGVDFLWLTLQHVLPKGFRRARNFGFLHANCKRLIALLQSDAKRFMPARKERPAMLCACCGAVMAIVRMRIRATSSAVVPRIGVAI